MKLNVLMIAFQFGKLPDWFQLWLNSAGANKNIIFWVYTDDSKLFIVPDNVKIKHITFLQMKDKISSRFDFNICIDRPYKICDYRPAFGYIFENEIQDFDFWGTIDLDEIMGDISEFITEDILKKYNRILTRDHFTLYRNTKEINRRFKMNMKNICAPYRSVFTDPKIYAFGERSPISVWHIWIDNGWYNEVYDKPIDANINYGLYRLKTVYASSENKGSVFAYENGKLYEYYLNENNCLKKKEWLYIHLARRNMSIKSINKNKFLILPNEFCEYQYPDATLLKKYNGLKIGLFDKMRLLDRIFIKIRRNIGQLITKIRSKG